MLLYLYRAGVQDHIPVSITKEEFQNFLQLRTNQPHKITVTREDGRIIELDDVVGYEYQPVTEKEELLEW